SLMLTLQSLSDEDLGELIDRAVSDARGLDSTVVLDDAARTAIIQLAAGDARRALTTLEAVATVALAEAEEQVSEQDGAVQVTLDQVERSVDRAVLRYDRDGDQHYDVVSAFIKSIRGSDPDAAIHYLARM